MMLPAEGPTTSLMEDLQALNLVENEAPKAVSNAKGNGYSKSDDDGGASGGGATSEEGYYKEGDARVKTGKGEDSYRINVPVRSGGLGRSDVGPDKANPAKNEDWDEDEEDFVSESNGKMVPNFLIPTEEEVYEAEEQAEVVAEEDRLTRAWEVVNTYFAESDDGLNEEGLRGVINAMGYALNTAVEDIANLSVENGRLSEAVNELTGLLSENDSCPSDDDDDDDDDSSRNNFAKMMMKKKKAAKKKSAYADDDEGEMGESRSYSRRGRSLQESDELYSLASELQSLGESRTTRAIDTQAKLVEAFEGVFGTCQDIVERIIDVMADDAGLAEGDEVDVEEDDERVQIARFFESICDDAAKYLDRLTDGNVPFKIAEADLSKLHADMEKGISAMHSVE